MALQNEKLQTILKSMYQKGADGDTIKALYRYLVTAKPDALLAINPNLLAVKLDINQQQIIDLVIYGVIDGLFEMNWEMACPHCGNIAEHTHHIDELNAASHCSSCKVDFDNFADENILISISVMAGLFAEKAPAPPAYRTLDKRVQPLTALDLVGSPLYRRYFSKEIPSLEQSIKIRSVTILFTDLIRSTSLYSAVGDIPAYAFVREHFESLFKQITEHAGGIIKTIGDAIMAIFKEPADAVTTAFKLKKEVADLLIKNNLTEKEYGLRVGISNGTALIVNMNNTLDLFGTTVNVAARIVNLAEKDTVAVTDAVFNNAAVKEYLTAENIDHQILHEKLKGIPGVSDVHLLGAKKQWFSKILG